MVMFKIINCSKYVKRVDETPRIRVIVIVKIISFEALSQGCILILQQMCLTASLLLLFRLTLWNCSCN